MVSPEVNKRRFKRLGICWYRLFRPTQMNFRHQLTADYFAWYALTFTIVWYIWPIMSWWANLSGLVSANVWWSRTARYWRIDSSKALHPVFGWSGPILSVTYMSMTLPVDYISFQTLFRCTFATSGCGPCAKSSFKISLNYKMICQWTQWKLWFPPRNWHLWVLSHRFHPLSNFLGSEFLVDSKLINKTHQGCSQWKQTVLYRTSQTVLLCFLLEKDI